MNIFIFNKNTIMEKKFTNEVLCLVNYEVLCNVDLWI